MGELIPKSRGVNRHLGGTSGHFPSLAAESAGFFAAKVVKVDTANDLALLKAEGKFSPLPVAPSRAVRLGNWVAMVGFPNVGLQGFAPKFARGEIAALSGLRRAVVCLVFSTFHANSVQSVFQFMRAATSTQAGARDDARYFQISVPVQPGNSGLRRAVVVSQHNSSRGTHARLTTRE